MNKLKLNFGQVDEILSREQMKHIVGGAGSCAIYFSPASGGNWYSTGSWGYTGAEYSTHNTVDGSLKVVGISLAEVEDALENTAGGTRRWCCDSCGSASWL